MRMATLSVRQPWAWAIVNGYKDIENRTRNFRRRGYLAIHASKGTTRNEYGKAADFIASKGIVVPPLCDLPRGCLVGRAKLSGCTYSDNNPSIWAIPYQYHLSLSDPFLFSDPIHFPGRQGLFYSEIPKEYLPNYKKIIKEAIEILIPCWEPSEHLRERQLTGSLNHFRGEWNLEAWQEAYFVLSIWYERELLNHQVHLPETWEDLKTIIED